MIQISENATKTSEARKSYKALQDCELSTLGPKCPYSALVSRCELTLGKGVTLGTVGLRN